jgi:hypothetical protein
MAESVLAVVITGRHMHGLLLLLLLLLELLRGVQCANDQAAVLRVPIRLLLLLLLLLQLLLVRRDGCRCCCCSGCVRWRCCVLRRHESPAELQDGARHAHARLLEVRVQRGIAGLARRLAAAGISGALCARALLLLQVLLLACRC